MLLTKYFFNKIYYSCSKDATNTNTINKKNYFSFSYLNLTQDFIFWFAVSISRLILLYHITQFTVIIISHFSPCMLSNKREFYIISNSGNKLKKSCIVIDTGFLEY